MSRHVALLRAVNVGGTGKLAMAELVRLCEVAGFGRVQTYIASGNAVFSGDGTEDEIRLALERQLRLHLGAAVGVVVRTAAAVADVLARNPFPDAPPNRVMALFSDAALPADPLDGVTGLGTEQVRLGRRELFVLYPDGMAATRLRIPIERTGTARNMNTVARLALMAADG